MSKRILAGFLWAFAAYSGWQLATGLWGATSLAAVGAVISIAIGVVVAIDPRNEIWKPSPERRLAQVPDRSVPASGVQAPGQQG